MNIFAKLISAYQERKARRRIRRAQIELARIEQERMELRVMAILFSHVAAACMDMSEPETLESQLHDAIRNEDYELAAKLRDKMRGAK